MLTFFPKAVSLPDIAFFMRSALVILAILSLGFAMACTGSTRGQWSAHDRREADEMCAGSLRALQSAPSATQALDKDRFCDCFTDKLEQRFESFYEAMNTRNSAVGDSLTKACLAEATPKP